MRLLAERAALREDAARLLDELGGTATEVAVSLHWMGIRVSTTGGADSPAARYLHAVVGADAQVRSVKVTKRWLVLKTHRRWRSTIRLRLPHPVREFSILVDAARADEVTEVPFEGDQS